MMRKAVTILLMISIAFNIAALLSACGPNEGTLPVDPPVTTVLQPELNEAAVSGVSGSPDEPSEAVVLQKESDNFYFYCAEVDISALDDIELRLESNYDRITSAFQVQIEGKTSVYIYPDLDAFHAAIGNPYAPDWLVGIMISLTSMKMVSPNNPGPQHDYDGIIEVAQHVFVHVAAKRVNITAPNFLSEGLATYMAGQNQGVAEVVSDLLAAGITPTYSQLKSISDGVYQIGYAYIEYIVAEYGYEKLVQFYKTPDDIEGVFGVVEDDFQANWINYLKTAY